MPQRLRLAPPTRPVSFHFDQDELSCEEGETVAEALHGAGYKNLSRSPKFHRPRGSACFRGACEGCLVRIDGVPNSIACLTPVRAGMRVSTQNSLGTRDLDLLRVTDWVFPHGINHHEFMAGVPGLQDAMQAIARRITGLGLLPDEALGARPAARRSVDVLIVGTGPSAQAIARTLLDQGRSVEMVDDAVAPGGTLRTMVTPLRARFEPSLFASTSVNNETYRERLLVRPRTTAGARFGQDLLVVGLSGAELVQARTVVFATGAHDTMPPFSGNDIPGVMSARAASLLWTKGIRPGLRPILVSYAESGHALPMGVALAAASGMRILRGTVLEVSGTSEVTSAVVLSEDGKRERLDVDAVIVDAVPAPAYELAIQSGARTRHEACGFVVETENGRIANGVYAIGEMVGTALDPAALAREAEAVAETIRAQL
jgi:sarcosine oxidase, subunit alpha